MCFIPILVLGAYIYCVESTHWQPAFEKAHAWRTHSHLCVSEPTEEDYGLYTNVYDLDLRNLDRTTITFFVYEILYCLALGMTKISIAFMYFRILEGRWWSRVLWATQAFNVLAILSVLIGLLLSCKPLDVYWASSWDAGGNCPDLWLWNGYSLGLNLFLDVWLIAIPSTYVWKTNLARRSKFAVTGMFCLGLVCVSFSSSPSLCSTSVSLTFRSNRLTSDCPLSSTMAMTIMRFVALEEAASTISECLIHMPILELDGTRMILTITPFPPSAAGDDLMAGLIWSTLEVVTAFLCACVPAMRLFIQHFFPVMKKGLSTFATSTVVTVTGSSRRASTKVGYGWRGISSNYPAAPANTTATVAGDEEIGGGGGGDAGAGRRLARSFGLSSKGAGLDGTMGEENGRDGGESRSGSVVHFGLASADTHEMIQVPGKAKSASAARYVV